MQRVLWIVFYVLDGVLLVSFILGYLGAYIHPRYAWWVQLFAIGLPYLSLLLLLAGALAVLSDRWLLVTLHFMGLLLILVRFSPRLFGSEGDKAHTEHLIVMTFNAKNKYGEERDDKALESLLQQEQPDVVALQEAPVLFGKEQAVLGSQRHIFSLLRSPEYDLLRPQTYHDQSLQIPVFSKIEWRGHEVLFSEEVTGATVSRTVLVWQGQPLTLFNVHLKSYGSSHPEQTTRSWGDPWVWLATLGAFRQDVLARASQAEQLRQFLNQETIPFILCGDFNSTPHNWVYRHLAEGLQDVFEKAGRGLGGTYHARLPLWRIDHVLVSSQWQVLSAHVGAASFSDHLPLTTSLSLASP